MTDRDIALNMLRSSGAEDLIPMLGLDQPAPRVINDAYRFERSAKAAVPRGVRHSPNYRGAP